MNKTLAQQIATKKRNNIIIFSLLIISVIALSIYFWPRPKPRTGSSQGARMGIKMEIDDNICERISKRTGQGSGSGDFINKVKEFCADKIINEQEKAELEKIREEMRATRPGQRF